MPLLANDIYCNDYDSEEDLGLDQAANDEDDDILLLSIQKRFGAFKPAEQDLPSPSYEEEDDEEILRAVQERFSSTAPLETNTDKLKKVVGRGGKHKTLCSSEQNSTNGCEKTSVEDVPVSEISSDFFPNDDVSLSPPDNSEGTGFIFPGQVEVFKDSAEGLPDEPVDGVVYDNDLLAGLSDDSQGQSIRSTLDALKKNRLCQRVLTSKLELLKSKLDENKDLKKRVTALFDFQNVAKRRCTLKDIVSKSAVEDCFDEDTKGRRHSLWPRVSSEGFKWGKAGLAENADAANFRAMQKKYSVRFEPKFWTKEERTELVKGVEQQVQESRIRSVMDMHRSGNTNATFLDDQVKAIAEHLPTPEDIRAAFPIINWNEVARLYVPARSPTECWIQWSNYEDCLIDQGPWTKTEDKRLWSIAKQHKLCNWDRICQALGSRRSIAQCLIRYQRSLNVGIMRGAWTREEDEQLRAAIQLYGDQGWSNVAATLEGRTGAQCWNRWHNILSPVRQKSGRWSVEEDKRLKLAVSIYGPKTWKIIASHVPGRTEVQCRERWCNILDPLLISAQWTAEEDQRLEAAIAKHGLHRWSTVALDLSPRTDNQCWRRWKYLHPDLFQAFQKDNKIQKAALVNNFVGRRKERSELLPSDFVPKLGAFEEAPRDLGISSDNNKNHQKGVKRKRCLGSVDCKTTRMEEFRADGIDELPFAEDGGDENSLNQKRKTTLTHLQRPKARRKKEFRFDGVDGHEVTLEFSKVRRAERLEKVRQARAVGRLAVWKRPISLTNLGVEEQVEPVSSSSRNGTTAFVKMIQELANFCGKTELSEPSIKSGRRSKEDQSKAGRSLSSLDRTLAGNGATKNVERDEEVEAAVKALLSWPFMLGIQDVWLKGNGGLEA